MYQRMCHLLRGVSCFAVVVCFAIFAYPIPSASADVLCVKNRQRVRSNRVVLKKTIKRFADLCPKGFTRIASTDEFVGATGIAGLDGQDGQDGRDGVDGKDGVSGYEIVNDNSFSFTPTPALTGQVNCPAGKVVIGGGCESQISNTYLERSMPVIADNGWLCHITSPLGQFAGNLEVYAICANASP